MDELLHEYIEQLDNDDNNTYTKTGFDPEGLVHDSRQSDNDDHDNEILEQVEYEDYIARTKNTITRCRVSISFAHSGSRCHRFISVDLNTQNTR